MKTLIITITILLVIGLIFYFRYNKCTKGCPESGNGSCIPQKCSFWTSKPIVNDSASDEVVSGKVDVWCEKGKYYKRTTTEIYGHPEMLEIDKATFDSLVSKGISYSGCQIDDKGNISPGIVSPIKISNRIGAIVYTQTANGMIATSQTISYGTQVAYTGVISATVCDANSLVCSSPSDFYKLSNGTFVSKLDITTM